MAGFMTVRRAIERAVDDVIKGKAPSSDHPRYSVSYVWANTAHAEGRDETYAARYGLWQSGLVPSMLEPKTPANDTSTSYNLVKPSTHQSPRLSDAQVMATTTATEETITMNESEAIKALVNGMSLADLITMATKPTTHACDTCGLPCPISNVVCEECSSILTSLAKRKAMATATPATATPATATPATATPATGTQGYSLTCPLCHQGYVSTDPIPSDCPSCLLARKQSPINPTALPPVRSLGICRYHPYGVANPCGGTVHVSAKIMHDGKLQDSGICATCSTAYRMGEKGTLAYLDPVVKTNSIAWTARRSDDRKRATATGSAPALAMEAIVTPQAQAQASAPVALTSTQQAIADVATLLITAATALGNIK